MVKVLVLASLVTLLLVALASCSSLLVSRSLVCLCVTQDRKPSYETLFRRFAHELELEQVVAIRIIFCTNILLYCICEFVENFYRLFTPPLAI